MQQFKWHERSVLSARINNLDYVDNPLKVQAILVITLLWIIVSLLRLTTLYITIDRSPI